MKVCTKCGVEKEEDNYRKVKNPAGNIVLRAECKGCEFLARVKFTNQNKDILNKRSNEWSKQNRQKVNVSKKKYYQKNSDKIIKRQTELKAMRKVSKGGNSVRTCKMCGKEKTIKFESNICHWCTTLNSVSAEKLKQKKQKEYQKNKENYSKLSNKWYQNNKEKSRCISRKAEAKSVEQLSDSYLKKVAKVRQVPKGLITETPAILKVIKEIIKIKRICNTNKSQSRT